MLWYPLKNEAAVARFSEGLVTSGLKRVCSFTSRWRVRNRRPELRVAISGSLPSASSVALAGAGLVIVNPPYTLKAEAERLLPWLAEQLQRQHRARGRRAGLRKSKVACATEGRTAKAQKFRCLKTSSTMQDEASGLDTADVIQPQTVRVAHKAAPYALFRCHLGSIYAMGKSSGCPGSGSCHVISSVKMSRTASTSAFFRFRRGLVMSLLSRCEGSPRYAVSVPAAKPGVGSASRGGDAACRHFDLFRGTRHPVPLRRRSRLLWPPSPARKALTRLASTIV